MNGRPSAEAIDRAGAVLARADAQAAQRTPRQQAEAAHVPGGPSIDELEALIRADRGLPPLRRTA